MRKKSTFGRHDDQLASDAAGEPRKLHGLVLVISIIGLVASIVLLALDYQWAFGLLLLFGMGAVLACVFWARVRQR